MEKKVFHGCLGFDWDGHTETKNREKHAVEPGECEEVFFNKPLLVMDDVRHSQLEPRWYALGRTDPGRRLFIVFTIRGGLLRVIFARDMSAKERIVHEQNPETGS